MSVYDNAVNRLDGSPADLHDYDGTVALVVNVASQCGLTPQYETLEKIYETYADRGFTVLAFPCNQFGAQEPGSPEEIATFCSTNYGVTFPIFEKIEVNGENRHPIYQELTQVEDAKGEAGDIKWNFEKFLLAGNGEVVARFGPMVVPDAPEVVEAIESNLPS